MYQVIWEKIKQIKGSAFLKAGVAVYFLGFLFLGMIGQNYTGFMSFLAPFSIISGIILISVGLIK
ncbi:MAG: hypothetical protein JW827_08075 [Spirochaetes bacterium]|nr:hypothetical protein [Spirochaetota bacterium]